MNLGIVYPFCSDCQAQANHPHGCQCDCHDRGQLPLTSRMVKPSAKFKGRPYR